MSNDAANIPVRVEVNEEEKTAIIIIPWTQLGKVAGDEFRAWLSKADKVRQEWQAKGYRCN